VAPPGGAVDWPADEGTLGVVGVAPWATLEFCRALYQRVNATKDWHYPRVLLDINTKIPSRGRHLQLGETDPSAAIAATIAELAGAGATLAVVVCNTAHILHDRWARAAPIPILHIIEETVRTAAAGGAIRVAPLVSASLAERDVYGSQANAIGLECLRLEGTAQCLINETIEEVKVAGRLGEARSVAIDKLLRNLQERGVDSVIAGCTELSVLESPCRARGLRFVDSNVALAEAALRRLALPGRLIDLAG
jgi:aspartate racemase